MALVPMRLLLDHAAENNYGLAAFNVNNMEQIQAIMEAAKDLGMNPAMKGSAAFADIRVLLALSQLEIDRWGAPIPDRAEKNGTPSARLIIKTDAPRSR